MHRALEWSRGQARVWLRSEPGLDAGLRHPAVRHQAAGRGRLEHHEKSQKLFLHNAETMGLKFINDLDSRDINGFFTALDCPRLARS